jgi:hypothetical protein
MPTGQQNCVTFTILADTAFKISLIVGFSVFNSENVLHEINYTVGDQLLFNWLYG